MTRINVPAQEQHLQDRFSHRKNSFYSQTVAENNARLEGKNIPADVLEELKFMQAALLTNGN